MSRRARNRGATLVELTAAVVGMFLVGVGVQRMNTHFQRATAALSNRAETERKMENLLDRLTALLQKRASYDSVAMPFPILGTLANGGMNSVIPTDSASCPNPVVSGTTESAACQDLRVYQSQAAGGYREFRMITRCVTDSAGRGVDNLKKVITPFGIDSDELQVCRTAPGESQRLPRFQISTISNASIPDLGYPTLDPMKASTEYFPAEDPSVESISHIRGVAVCFRVCHPLQVAPAVYRSPESIMIQIGAVYRTGEMLSDGRPRFEVVDKQRMLNFKGQSSTIEFLSAK